MPTFAMFTSWQYTSEGQASVLGIVFLLVSVVGYDIDEINQSINQSINQLIGQTDLLHIVKRDYIFIFFYQKELTIVHIFSTLSVDSLVSFS